MEELDQRELDPDVVLAWFAAEDESLLGIPPYPLSRRDASLILSHNLRSLLPNLARSDPETRCALTA